jgi:predicted small metal-binding protein
MTDAVTYTFACGDLMDGCPQTFRGSRDAIMGSVQTHAAEVHGIAPVPDDVAEAVLAHMMPAAA